MSKTSCKRCEEAIQPSWVESDRTAVCPACLTFQRVGKPENEIKGNSLDWLDVEQTPGKWVFRFPSRPFGRLLLLVCLSILLLIGLTDMNLFRSPFFWLTLPLVYWVAARFWNQNSLILNHDEVRFTSSPLPFPGWRLPKDQVKGVFVKKHHNRIEGSPSYSYSFWLLQNSGRTRRIMAGEDSPDILDLEAQIEQALIGKLS